MSEKQASSEIAQSWERFHIAAMEWAERDTRERCAQIADELCKTYESQSQNLAAHYAELVAERIRGKE